MRETPLRPLVGDPEAEAGHAILKALAELTGPCKRTDADYTTLQEHGPLPLATFETRLEQIKPVLPFSDMALDVLGYLNGSQRCEAQVLVALIGRDSPFAEQLLQIINSSAYYRGNGPITQLTDAIGYLGIKRVGELALGVSSFGQPSATALPWFDHRLAQQRSLAAALAANQILQWHKPTAQAHGVMFGAMMYPLARLVTGTAYPALYEVMLTESYRTQKPLLTLEQEWFPHTPASALARLLTRWGIPAEHCLPLRYADLPFAQLGRLAPEVQTVVQILKAAILLGEMAVGKWHSWDEISFPTNMQLREVGAGAPREIVELISAQIRGEVTWAAPPQDESPPWKSAAASPTANAPAPRPVLPYYNLALEVGELLPGLLESMNFEVQQISSDQQCTNADALINCLHTPISWLAAKAQGATRHNWVILTTEQYPASWNWMGHFLQTPTSYQAIRFTCEQFLRIQPKQDRTAPPGPQEPERYRASEPFQPKSSQPPKPLPNTPPHAPIAPKPRDPDIYEPLNADA